MVVQHLNWNFCSGPPCVELTERRHPRPHLVLYQIAPCRRRRLQKKNDVFNIILRSEKEFGSIIVLWKADPLHRGSSWSSLLSAMLLQSPAGDQRRGGFGWFWCRRVSLTRACDVFIGRRAVRTSSVKKWRIFKYLSVWVTLLLCLAQFNCYEHCFPYFFFNERSHKRI